jgi:TolB-like protein
MLSLPLMAQKFKDLPNWLAYDKRDMNYPKDVYITGFSSEALKSEEDVNDAQSRLVSSARTIMNESVLTEIKSMTTSQIINTTNETYESFKQVSMSVTKLKVSDLATEFYFDPKTKNAYAFAYAPKTKIRDNYKSEMESNTLNLKILEDYARDSTAQNKIRLLNKLLEGEKYAQECGNDYAILMALDAANKATYVALLQETLEKQKIINKAIEALKQNKNLRSDEAQEFIAQSIGFQLAKDSTPIWISNFSYESSGIVSPYSDKFAMGLTEKFLDNKIKLTKNAKLINKYILKGFFWKEANYVRVNVSVLNQETGDIVAAVESGIAESFVINNGINIEPENYNQAVKNMVLFNENLVTSNGGLTVALTTNKGSENLLYEEGDTLKIYLKANKPCFVRFIYHLADGNKVLLYDNFNITSSLTNKVIEIPEYFICTDPYGVETLQLMAQTEEFAPLTIYKEYGYNFIDGNLQNILKKSRGFKPAKQEDGSAEQYMMITTMAKSW